MDSHSHKTKQELRHPTILTPISCQPSETAVAGKQRAMIWNFAQEPAQQKGVGGDALCCRALVEGIDLIKRTQERPRA